MGIELVSDKSTKKRFENEAEVCARLNEKFRERHMILAAAQGKVYIAPPICTTREDVDEMVAKIDGSIGDLERDLRLT